MISAIHTRNLFLFTTILSNQIYSHEQCFGGAVRLHKLTQVLVLHVAGRVPGLLRSGGKSALWSLSNLPIINYLEGTRLLLTIDKVARSIRLNENFKNHYKVLPFMLECVYINKYLIPTRTDSRSSFLALSACPKITSLSALVAYSGINWQGGAALCP